MKAELIADWRLRIKDKTLITIPISAIERIFEERHKLLAALKHAGFYDPSCEDCTAAKAALAYAEGE